MLKRTCAPTVTSYGGGAGVGGGAMHHGHGGKSPELEIDDERFFRAVARAVTEHHSQPSKLPLILAALPEHQALFRRVSHNPALLEAGITTNPDALSGERLREQAWEVFEPQYLKRLKALQEEAGYARSKELGSDDLTEVAAAAVAGRVQTLLIEAGRRLPGRIDPKTGEVTLGKLEDPQTDDVLDDLADLVSEMGGEVVVVPAESMKTETGLSAIYRCGAGEKRPGQARYRAGLRARAPGAKRVTTAAGLAAILWRRAVAASLCEGTRLASGRGLGSARLQRAGLRILRRRTLLGAENFLRWGLLKGSLFRQNASTSTPGGARSPRTTRGLWG